MSKAIRYKVLTDLRLIVEYFYGTIGISDFSDHCQETIMDKSFDQSFNIIRDFREATIDITPKDIKIVGDQLKSMNIIHYQRNIALLVTDSRSTALIHLFDSAINHELIKIQIFSSGLRAALPHVGISANELGRIEDLLVELKSRTE